MDASFIPSADVTVVLNALLDIVERRPSQNGTVHPGAERSGRTTQPRSIKIALANLSLPTYFSQTDPTPRLIANEQFALLEKNGLIALNWLPGETNHILQSIKLTEHAIRNHELFDLISRTPIANNRTRLELLLLADKFRFQEDWRARAISYTLNQLKAKKSPTPFSLTDSNLNSDLLTVLQSLPALTTETPFRVFSVRVFNDSKRFEAIKHQLVKLARIGLPEWKRIPAEEVLRELNLVANPSYIHLAGNWQITTDRGEILNLEGFAPSIGFPAAQISSLRSVRAESVLCIENLTSFHEYLRAHTALPTQHATICLMGNPSPSIRQLLRLIPEETPVYLWSDIDYGGFNILSQLRKQVSHRVQPYLMDITTFENYVHLSRPLTKVDTHNLKRLAHNPNLKDVHLTIEHILKRQLKLEQEAIQT